MNHRISISFLFFFSLVLLSGLATASNFGYDSDTSASIVGGDTIIFNFTINGTEAIHNELTDLQGGNATEYFHINQTIWTYLMNNLYSFGSSSEILWSANYSLYNDSWTSTTNSSYYLATNPFGFWNDTHARFNETYADTLYSPIDEPLWSANQSAFNDTWSNRTNYSYVPYIGATADVMLGEFNLTAANLTSTDNIYLADRLIHFGDEDTYMGFTNNIFLFTAGGNTAMGITDDAVTFGLNVTAPTINFTGSHMIADFFCNSTDTCYTVTEFLSGGGSGNLIWTNDTEEVYIDSDYPQSLNISGNLTVTSGPSTFSGAVLEGNALGYDNVKIGVELGTPRILIENAGEDIWGVDVYSDSFRFYTTTGAGFPVLSLNSTSVYTNEGLYVVNNTYVTENVTAGYFVGDGSFLTNVNVSGGEEDPYWSANYTLYNSTWSNKTNFSYVPYTGATSNVDLGNYNLTTTATGFFDFLEVTSNISLTNDIWVGGYSFLHGYVHLFGDLFPQITLTSDFGSGS